MSQRLREAAIPALLLLVLGLAVTLPRLGDSGLWDPWEPKYAQGAREMAQRGDWIVPYYREDVRLVKPPMTYWMIGASQGLFGLSEAAARLPSALLAALCPALLAFALGLQGRRPEAWLSGLALLTAPQWVLEGRFATPDIPFAAAMAAGLACVLAATRASESRRDALGALAVVALGLATLTEWPRGLMLACSATLVWGALRRPRWFAPLALVLGLYTWAQNVHHGPANLVAWGLGSVAALGVLRVEGGIAWRKLAAGLLLLLLVAGPWFALAFYEEPEQASYRMLGYKHGLNLGESLDAHRASPLYVLQIVSVGALPWIGAALAGLLFAMRRSDRSRDPELGVAAASALGFLLFFALAEAKMGHFYAVIQPSLAVLAGFGAVALVRGARPWLATPFIALVPVLYWIRDDRDPSVILETATVKRTLYGIVDLTGPATLAVAAWCVLLVAAWFWRRPAWLAATAAPTLALALFLGSYAVPSLATRKSTLPMWTAYAEARQGDEPLGSFSTGKDSTFYYSDNAILRLYDGRELLRFLQGPGDKYLIVTKKAFRDIQRSRGLEGSWETLVDDHPSHLLARFRPH